MKTLYITTSVSFMLVCVMTMNAEERNSWLTTDMVSTIHVSDTPDTLINVTTPARIVITENSRESSIRIIPNDGSDEINVTTTYPNSVTTVKANRFMLEDYLDNGFLKNKDEDDRWSFNMQGVCLGFNRTLECPQSSYFQTSRSLEICWMSCLGVNYRFSKVASLSMGLGFDWRNYKSAISDRYLFQTENKGITINQAPKDQKIINSRVKIFSLQVPLLLKLKVPSSSLRFKFGPIVCFNTHASVLTKLNSSTDRDSEVSSSVSSSALNPRDVTLDAFASISLDSTIGLYVRYSPMKMFQKSSPVNFTPLSMGFTIGI